jgi:hypothetical protein
MRILMLFAGAAIGLGSTTFQAEAACNARGEFCGYPTWAANAFSSPEDRVPEYFSDIPETTAEFGYVAPGPASAYGYAPAAYGYAPGYGYMAIGNTQDRYRNRYPR